MGDLNVHSASGNGSQSRALNRSPQAIAPAHGGHAQTGPFDAQADASADGLLHILGRRWPTLVLTTILALLLSVVYLMLAPKVYTSVATLRVQPLDTQAISNNTSGNSSAESTSDFLDTECVVIKSNAVLALAMDKVRDLKTLRGVDHPMDYLKAKLTADVAKKGSAIEVAFDSRYKDDANQVVSSVVTAYKEYESNYWAGRARNFLDILHGGEAVQQQDLKDKQTRMMALAREHGLAFNIDPEKSPAHQEVVALNEAMNKAHLDAIAAKDAHEEGAKALIGNPDKLAAYDRALQTAGYSANPAEQLKSIQDQLYLWQARLSDAERQYLPNHPAVRAIQGRVDQLTVDSVVAAKVWQDAAESREEALEKGLADAQRREVDLMNSQAEYKRLDADVNRLKGEGDRVDQKMREIDLGKGAGAMNISLLDPAELKPDPKPNTRNTMAVAGVLGLIAGLGLACVRDWSDDRLRTPAAVRAVTGAPVLGAVPIITAAATASDRGQIVHHDPFGDAAECYRTLRTALQYGLPARTKTLLVTSAVAGEGKSTLVSNLAIAMAQANRRVLVIDADFRAPVQHRLFGLRDHSGLATVLNGADTLDGAIQRTEIEGLDVLPCGPIPSNPAEMLNDPAFADHLNDLADRYDLVLLDSPPVTAVTDARILAASADASLLVVRPESSTRKQLEAARDGLRSVGARLIGVAVNAVPRRGSPFANTSGYYPRTEMLAANHPASRDPISDAVRATEAVLATDAVRQA